MSSDSAAFSEHVNDQKNDHPADSSHRQPSEQLSNPTVRTLYQSSLPDVSAGSYVKIENGNIRLVNAWVSLCDGSSHEAKFYDFRTTSPSHPVFFARHVFKLRQIMILYIKRLDILPWGSSPSGDKLTTDGKLFKLNLLIKKNMQLWHMTCFIPFAGYSGCPATLQKRNSHV